MSAYDKLQSMNFLEFTWLVISNSQELKLMALLLICLFVLWIVMEIVAYRKSKRRKLKQAELRQRFEAEFSDMTETERLIYVYLAMKASGH